MNKYDNLLLHILLGFLVWMVLFILLFGVECKAQDVNTDWQHRQQEQRQEFERRRQENIQYQMEYDIRRLEQQQQEFERQLEYERNDPYSPY